MGSNFGSAEDMLFAKQSSSSRAGGSSNAALGLNGSSSIPFPREPLPLRRLPERDETHPERPERQMRDKEMQDVSKRIVQLAMAWPETPHSVESFSVDTHEVLEIPEGIASKPSGAGMACHPPVSVR